jgi:hypothetical protein
LESTAKSTTAIQPSIPLQTVPLPDECKQHFMRIKLGNLTRLIRVLLFLFLFPSASVWAQQRGQYIDLNATLNHPTGFFARKVPDTRFGGQLGFFSQFRQGSPLLLGAEMYYFTLGQRKARLTEWIDFKDVEVDYTTISHVLGFGGKARFYPGVHVHKIDLFLEASAGFKWLFTHTTTVLADNVDVSDGFLEKGSLSLTYSAAAGIHYAASETFYIQSRLHYLPGLSSKYYVPNSTQQVQSSSLDLFTLVSSPTDMLRFDVGFFIKIENTNE